MKNLIMIAFMIASTCVTAQDLQELKVDLQQPIDNCSLELIVNDICTPVKDYQIEGTVVTLYLKEYEDYMLIINCNEYINITLHSWDVIDERDLSVSADIPYRFDDGILIFEY
jgi:hypothetical protein